MPCVLVVDDDPDIVEMLVALLELQGYQTVVARDGEEAVTQAVAVRPALIVMDIAMPKADGIQATREIRERLGRGPGIVAHTAIDRATLAERFDAAGFDAHVPKSSDVERLLEALAGLASRA